MLLDLLFLLVLGLMIALGAWRGALVSGAGLFGLVLGYVGAGFAAFRLDEWVAETLVVSTILAPPIAGTLGFVVTWLVVSSLFDVVVAWDRHRHEDEERGAIDRALGGFFGLARGALIVVLLSLLVTWLDAGRDLGAITGWAGVPDSENSAVARVSSRIVEAGVSSALSDAGPVGVVAARLTSQPAMALEHVQSIVSDERLAEVFEDKLFWTLMSSNSVDHAMNRRAILSVVNDPVMRGRFVDLGLVGSEAREDVAAFRGEMADVFHKMAPRVKQLQNDPAITELANDPEIIQMVVDGDTFGLINHPRFRRVVDHLTQDL